MLLDISAPIVPFESCGGIKLYSTRDELQELLQQEGVKSEILFNGFIRYDIQNSIELFFHSKNNKLFRITTLDDYQGKLFEKIKVGMTEEEFLEAEPSFVYDEFEEVWESKKGVFIETDAKTHIARWISVYIKELDDECFEEAKW